MVMRHLHTLSSGRLRLPMVAALLIGLLLAAAPAGTVRAATHVCVDPGSPSCYNTIGEAVGVVSDGDTIFVHAGTYHEHDITIVTSIIITGSGGPILDAGGLGSGFIIQQGAAVAINGLTVQAAHTGIVNGSGDVSLVGCLIRNNSVGGILNDGTLTLSSTTISGNTTTNVGGGVFNQLGTLTMDNSAIQNNTAYEGGGVYNLATMTMTNSSVNYNHAQGGVGGGIENRHAHLTMTNGSAIVGNTAASGDGGGLYNDVGSVVTLDNSVIGGMGTDGNAAHGSGGGIFNTGAGSTVTIQNHSRVTGNTANGTLSTQGGGGISTGSGTQTTLIGSTVSKNQVGSSSGSGGGIGNFGGNLTLANMTVSGNTAYLGGGIYNGWVGTQGIATVTNSTISGNSGVYGGGIANSDGSLTVQGSTISGNGSFADGAGIYNDGSASPVMATNSTLSGNAAGGNGGGIFSRFNAVSSLTNSTFSGNTATTGSDGIYHDSGAGPTTLKNTLVADGCIGTVISGDYNLDSGATCHFARPHDLASVNPVLGTLQVNAPGLTATHALLVGSAAVDRGGTSANGCPATDQRGISRPVGGACDIGAYEMTPPSSVPPPRPAPVMGPPPPLPLPPSGRGMPTNGSPPASAPMPRP
jgi:hypothetical protein